MGESEEIVEYRVYKVKPYLNSNRDPFGLTINGKTKEYIVAHETLKGLIKKGKQYKVEEGVMKILDVTSTKSILNAIVEVSGDTGVKGNVELKIYNPSLSKKKGATIELRKMSDFEYSQVELLKNIITVFLDGFIVGNDVNEVIKNHRMYSTNKPRVTSKPRLFNCDLCDWQTKFGSGLKVHKTRIHKVQTDPVKQFKCDACIFQSKTKVLLDEHVVNNHKQNNKRSNDIRTPSSSPPRKKQDGLVESPNMDHEEDESNVEMIDLEIEANDLVRRLLENRIKELEKIIAGMQDEKEKEKLFQIKLQDEIIQLRSGLSESKIPDHLSGVLLEHLPKLRGYKMIFKADSNGACLQNCFAVHAYEDQDEAPKLKKKLNNYVADNWNYFKNKIALPYVETVGVGEDTKLVTINTDEEMLEFLRSDEALMVYSNSQELLAIANMFNINISIFSYGGVEDRWAEVSPDPEIANSEVNWVPDMALYHAFETHYDLLVKDDSRLAVLDLRSEINKNDSNVEVEMTRIDDDWEVVNRKQNKNSGHKRTAPQENSENVSRSKNIFKCDQCEYELESQGLLYAHMMNHEAHKPKNSCEVCDQDFRKKSELEKHIEEEHTSAKISVDEWICNDCSFQGNCASELIKHLKLTGHQPSQNENDRRKIFKDLKQCYTCKMEFDGFYNLMNHRKIVHPSNKRCRNFPGNCNFGKECWYVHEDQMETESLSGSQETFSEVKCNFCKATFKHKSDFMQHRKTEHPENNQACKSFENGQCEKNEEECWFIHSYSTEKPKMQPSQLNQSSKDQVFQKATINPFPPDQIQISKMFWMVSNLCMKVQNIEKKFEELLI